MTAYTAHWDDAIAAPRPTRSVLGQGATALSHAFSRRRTRMILSDLDDHILDDIGLDPRTVRPAAQTSGWIVAATARMPSMVFLGR